MLFGPVTPPPFYTRAARLTCLNPIVYQMSFPLVGGTAGHETNQQHKPTSIGSCGMALARGSIAPPPITLEDVYCGRVMKEEQGLLTRPAQGG